MIDLQLDDNEAEALRGVLESTLKNLSYEIADTDTSSFRDQLKERREVLTAILTKLGGSSGT